VSASPAVISYSLLIQSMKSNAKLLYRLVGEPIILIELGKNIDHSLITTLKELSDHVGADMVVGFEHPQEIPPRLRGRSEKYRSPVGKETKCLSYPRS
jgi:hypothetical protein